MSKYLDSSGVQQLWKAVTNADNAVKTIINGLNLSYDPETKLITLTGNNGALSTSFDASDGHAIIPPLSFINCMQSKSLISSPIYAIWL